LLSVCYNVKTGDMASFSIHRMTTCLENLEMSGNLTAVRDMSGILLKVREVSGENILSGKSGLKLFIVSCIFAFILDFNTSTGMIRVKLNMGRSAANCRGNVMEFHVVWRVVTLHTVLLSDR